VSNLSDFQYPPPKHWQDFESLCRDLCEKVWKDPQTQKNGRPGQAQHGVDIYGRPNQKDSWAGLQCKGKDNFLGKGLTVEELRAEVENAKAFQPALSEWILATTAPRDSKVQEEARKITTRHVAEGLFSVTVWGWEEIIEQLLNFPALITKHLPQIGDFDPATTQRIEDLDTRTRTLSSEQSAGFKGISTSFTDVSSRLEGIQNIRAQDILTPEYNSEIDDIRDLVKKRLFKSAVDSLLKLKNRLWSNSSDRVKFRILTNLGDAYYQWGKLDKAGALFMEAHQYSPDDEIALTNLALAYSFQSDFEKTKEFARLVLEKNPANVNGYCILLQTPPLNDDVDAALNSVPTHLADNPLIAYCLGLAAQNQTRFDVALKWFETAVKNDTENNPVFKASFATMLTQSLWSVRSPLITGQVSSADKEILHRAIELLTDAWEQIKDTDAKEGHPVWLLNRGIAKKLLGEIEEALVDVRTAYEMDPADPEAGKHFALVLLKSGDVAGAIQLLKQIKDNRAVPEVSPILADLFCANGESSEAISVVVHFLEWNDKRDLTDWCYRILVEAHLQLEEVDHAQKYADMLVAEWPNAVSSYVSAAQIPTKQGNNEAAVSLLVRGMKAISEETAVPDLVSLAGSFFSLQKYQEAAQCYEIFTNTDQDTTFSLSLLASYYYAGILSKALQMSRALRDKQGILDKPTEIEIAVLEETNDLASSRDLAIEYLKVFPEKFSVKLRLARLNYLLGDIEQLEAFLNEIEVRSASSLDDGLTISAFLGQVGRIKESFDLMYELRRKFFHKADAHSFFFANFFSYEGRITQSLYTDSADLNFAVCVRRIDGQEDWYIIEDRPDADFQKHELDRKHPLAQELLGKKVGEEIRLKRSAQNEESAKIVSIKSKFLYALHESFAVYETMFPDRRDFFLMHVGKEGDGEDAGEIDIERIREMLSSRSKHVTEAMNLYQTTGLTVGVIAELIGCTAYEGWEALLTNHLGLTFCASGVQTLFDESLRSLCSEVPPRLVADITSLHLARALKVEDKIVEHFGKLIIAPTTLFALYRRKEELKTNRSTGILSMAEKDGVLYKHEVTADEVKKYVDQLDQFIGWIEANCEVSPHKNGFDLERNYKMQLRKALLPEFFDTSLSVNPKHHLLFTEDDRLSNVAKSELGIERTWMQPVLFTIKTKGQITEDEYTEALLSLTSSNLEHIHFESAVLLEALRKSNWLPDEPYLSVLKRLRGKRATVQSAVGVATNFLFDLESVPLTAHRYEALVINLLENLISDRNRKELLAEFIRAVKSKFYFLPVQKSRILNVIDLWSTTQVIV